MKKIIFLFSLLFTSFAFAQEVNLPENLQEYLISYKCVDLNDDGRADEDADFNNNYKLELNEIYEIKNLIISELQKYSNFLKEYENFIEIQNHYPLSYMESKEEIINFLKNDNKTYINPAIINSYILGLGSIFKNLKKLYIHNIFNDGHELDLYDTGLLYEVNLKQKGFNVRTNNKNNFSISPNEVYDVFETINTANNGSFLVSLNIDNNNIKNINLHSGFFSLQKISLGSNLLNLDLTKLTNLTHLGFKGTNFNQSNLDLSKNTKLKEAIIYYPNISEIDFSNNVNLERLLIGGFKIKEGLNLSNNHNINELIVTDSYFKSINLQNSNRLKDFTFQRNPNLKYICVDNDELEQITQYCKTNNINAEINTYCSFSPTGNKNTITGKLTFDVTNNGCDVNDALAKNIKVKINDGTTTGYTLTNETANYTFYAQTGNFTLTPIFENPYYTVSPATVNFADVNNNVKTQDFCIKPAKQIKDLTVSLVPIDRARPGFNSKYKLIYKNKGTTTQNASVSFTYDKNYTTFVSSTVVATSSTADTKTWSISNLKPFEEKSIEITLKLNKPDHPTYKLVGGEILDFKGLISPTGDETPLDNEFSLKQEVVNSFDPNDKTCLQGNSITPNMIGNYVDYQIRFENTGSANAEFIVVKDIIDTNLFDIESLVPVASSHPYHLTIKNGNIVEFYFENINLPYPPSELRHGFITFKIKTKSTLKLGDVLKNKADIYFDYNKPIVTNEEQTKIENLSSEEISNLNTQISILFTNPVKDVIKFSEEVQSISIFDLSGKLVQSSIVNGTEANISSLKSGNYVIKIFTENGNVTGKLIKE